MDSRLQPRHPMRLVSQRTGLTAHVLRAWERRYGAVNPQRSAGGQRLYSDRDIERLILIKRATEAGHSLRTTAVLGEAELRALQRTPGLAEDAGEPSVMFAGDGVAETRSLALEQVGRLDQAGLAATLRRAAMAYGLWDFVAGVAVPLMREIGVRWHAGVLGVANEHMASAVVRSVFAWVNDDTTPCADDAQAIVIGTLAGERHEMGALLAAAVAALDGWRVTYLGTDLPLEEMAAAAAATSADVVALSATVTENGAGDAATYRRLQATLGPTPLVVGGTRAAALRAGTASGGFQTMADLETFRTWLQGRRPGVRDTA